MIPGPDLIAVLFGHDASDLADVREIVNGPRREKLPKRHGPECRVCALPGKLIRTDVELPQSCKSACPKLLEFPEELRE